MINDLVELHIAGFWGHPEGKSKKIADYQNENLNRE
jgi:hypothetical protein